MTIKLSAKQNFVLWQLLLNGDDVALTKLDPRLTPAERKPLLDAGLIDLVKRGQSNHVLLTDKTWAWACEQTVSPPYASKKHAPLLFQTLISKLQVYLQTNGIPLSEFLTTQATACHSDDGANDNKRDQPRSHNGVVDFATMAAAIRTTYRRITGGKLNTRVRLAELHKELPFGAKEMIDTTLRQMQLNGELVLMPLDDPKGIYAEDQAAAVNISGDLRHIVYLKG